MLGPGQHELLEVWTRHMSTRMHGLKFEISIAIAGMAQQLHAHLRDNPLAANPVYDEHQKLFSTYALTMLARNKHNGDLVTIRFLPRGWDDQTTQQRTRSTINHLVGAACFCSRARSLSARGPDMHACVCVCVVCVLCVCVCVCSNACRLHTSSVGAEQCRPPPHSRDEGAIPHASLPGPRHVICRGGDP